MVYNLTMSTLYSPSSICALTHPHGVGSVSGCKLSWACSCPCQQSETTRVCCWSTVYKHSPSSTRTSAVCKHRVLSLDVISRSLSPQQALDTVTSIIRNASANCEQGEVKFQADYFSECSTGDAGNFNPYIAEKGHVKPDEFGSGPTNDESDCVFDTRDNAVNPRSSARQTHVLSENFMNRGCKRNHEESEQESTLCKQGSDINAKRLSPFLNTPKQRKEERKKIFRLSAQKFKLIEDPELVLRRSVLIRNTIRKIQEEIREEKRFSPAFYNLLKDSTILRRYAYDQKSIN